MVKSMAQLHHGSIDVTSEFGEWTEFVVILLIESDRFEATEI